MRGIAGESPDAGGAPVLDGRGTAGGQSASTSWAPGTSVVDVDDVRPFPFRRR
jgi:hypothetical protein